jgi:hypothetical protein
MVQNKFLSTMVKERLNDLSVLCIEIDIIKPLSHEEAKNVQPGAGEKE